MKRPSARVSTRRKALLAMVHLAKKQLGLDDETYRAILSRVTGHESASACAELDLERVVDAMRERGFTPVRKNQRSQKPHVRKIWGLWAELERSGRIRSPGRAACRAFVKRMTDCADPEWPTIAQANTVIEALKAWLERPIAEPAREPS